MLVPIQNNILSGQSFIAGQFNCPKEGRDGTYEDTRQCDKYYECYDGIAEERLCPDGLVFDPFSNKREPCDHYFNVDCGDRLELRKFLSYQIESITVRRRSDGGGGSAGAHTVQSSLRPSFYDEMQVIVQ